MNLPPLSLYIHIPWCVRKCPYCDFNSHTLTATLDEAAYVQALLADLDSELPWVGERSLLSIFIGGGTPSLFHPQAIGALLRGVRERLDWSSGIEITLEANPGAVEAGRFADLREAGVNRLSLGVQSFEAESLRVLERIHGPEEAVRAVEQAQSGGFERINLDLMFGLPGQTGAQALRDVNTALELNTEHLSYYQLTLEPNTRFHHQPPALPDEEQLWEIQQAGQQRLEAAGFGQYEVSAFARQGAYCRHNLNYWRFGDYIGIGAGAHGKLTSVAGTIQRRWKQRHPQTYLETAPGGRALQGERALTRQDRVIEFMMNALRLRQGVEAALFEATTGLAIDEVAGSIDRARERGLLSADRMRLCATPLGFRFLTDLLSLFEIDT